MSQEWITTMRVHQLSNGANQPFYTVLVQDGTCRYAAQGKTPIHQHGDWKTNPNDEPVTVDCVLKNAQYMCPFMLAVRHNNKAGGRLQV